MGSLASRPILEIERLTRRFGSVWALRDLSLTIATGEFVTVLGPSGCGKSTLLGLIAGFHAPTSGVIAFRGRDISPLAPAERNIGMVFQHYALFPHMSVAENIAYGPKMRGWTQARRRDRVAAMLGLVRLEGYEDRWPWQLSGGQQQRVALARALAFEPSLLLMDEPLGALDREIRLEMQEEIRRIHQELGTTVVYVTHDKEEALALSDRIAILRAGRLVAIDEPAALYERPPSAFVASFFGGANLVPASLVGRGGEGASLRVGDATVRVATPLEAAGTVLVAISPERLRVEPVPEALAFPVTVVDVLYLGEVIQVTARSTTVGKLTVRIPAAERTRVARGANLTLYARASDLVILPAEGEPSE
jgi:putative spermidine/putrescine transport system ATP-binding protein